MKLLLINSLMIILLFASATSCRDADDSNSSSQLKIWSDEILAIEFLENDTIPFFLDTHSRSSPNLLIFVSDDDFEKSKILNIQNKQWLKPLLYSNKLFSLYFEVELVNERCIQVKNGNSMNNAFYWVPMSESSPYKIVSWPDFLLGQHDLNSLAGKKIDEFNNLPSDEAALIKAKSIDCISIRRIVEDNWLEVGVKGFCENDSFDFIGFVKWKDDNDKLLIKFY